jgi:hypothetical protein
MCITLDYRNIATFAVVLVIFLGTLISHVSAKPNILAVVVRCQSDQ